VLKPFGNRAFGERPILEQRAAASLVTLAEKETDLAIKPKAMDSLVYALVGEADREVIDEMANEEKPPSREEVEYLRGLQAMIEKRLKYAVKEGLVNGE